MNKIQFFLLSTFLIIPNWLALAEESPQQDIIPIIANFTGSEWGKVSLAQKQLMEMGKESIPHLLNLMQDEKRIVKLENTFDLIYPGATKFYGTGPIINYDIDWIAIRAGWALESLTFQNFGFMETFMTEKELMQLHMDGYQEYLKKGYHDVNFKKEAHSKLSESIRIASDWWIANKKDWTELKGIKDALYSNDTIRQLNALSHLRYPDYRTVGWTEKYYNKNLKQRVKELAKSTDEDVSTQAKLKLGL